MRCWWNVFEDWLDGPTISLVSIPLDDDPLEGARKLRKGMNSPIRPKRNFITPILNRLPPSVPLATMNRTKLRAMCQPFPAAMPSHIASPPITASTTGMMF
jgi:hypothetical protein